MERPRFTGTKSVPNRTDAGFQQWANEGLIKYNNLYEGGHVATAPGSKRSICFNQSGFL